MSLRRFQCVARELGCQARQKKSVMIQRWRRSKYEGTVESTVNSRILPNRVYFSHHARREHEPRVDLVYRKCATNGYQLQGLARAIGSKVPAVVGIAPEPLDKRIVLRDQYVLLQRLQQAVGGKPYGCDRTSLSSLKAPLRVA
jgi:hypothetical protein